jgi:cytochrome c oxidase cbb3-type subunit 3
MKRRAALVLAAGLLALTGCGERAAGSAMPAAARAAPAPVDSATLELGRKVYNYRCYFCHGYSGDAKTLATTYLSPPPRDFTRGTPLDAPAILATVREGRGGTAMKSFRGILDEGEMAAVAAFVAREFVRDKARNTAYHTPGNGWPDHHRFAAAFPFATGTIPLDAPVDSLDASQRAGRQLFLSACVSCHDRAHVADEGPAWSSRPLSYPRMGFVPGQDSAPPVDAVSSASVYAKHEVVPRIAGLNAQQRRGEQLFQANCAFCHGADGTGKNWIGQFMEPKARDLTMFSAQSMPAARLRATIRDGLPGTSMPAWRHVLGRAEIDAVADYVVRAFFRRDGG